MDATAISFNSENPYCITWQFRVYPVFTGSEVVDVKQRFANNLRRLLSAHNTTAFRKYVEVSSATLSRWQNPKLNDMPTAAKIDRISSYLGIDASELFINPEPSEISPEMINAAIKTLAKAHGYKAALTKIEPNEKSKESGKEK